MSTLKNNTSGGRMRILLSKGEKIFHIKDLANIWEIQNRNTLRVTLKRYVESGLLFRIYRGFYSVLPVSELSPLELGAKAIHDYCYLSTETVLYEAGVINQNIDFYTFVGPKSLKFSIGPYKFICRQLKDEFLFNSQLVTRKGNILVAEPLRAVADLLYFNPLYHFDRNVDWSKLHELQLALNYPPNVERFNKNLKHDTA